jgi:hypothetical protein
MSFHQASYRLPRKRTAVFLWWIDHLGLFGILIAGMALCLGVPWLFAGVEFLANLLNNSLVFGPGGKAVDDIWQLVVYNYARILGAGTEVDAYRVTEWIAVVEAFTGILIFGLFVSIFTAKTLLPPRNAIVFSKYAYYCTDNERFLTIFVNTTKDYLDVVQICSYFKLGGDWAVRPAITAPFVTQSVQTFFLDAVPLERIRQRLTDYDCLRVGISGNVGFVTHTASAEYDTDSILVIPNRGDLVRFDDFRNPCLESRAFEEKFHYHPQGAMSLREYVTGVGADHGTAVREEST